MIAFRQDIYHELVGNMAQIKKGLESILLSSPLCDPAGIRTQDPYIKSVMLYRLSYGIILFPHGL